jgi:methyl-accepting chemotaxis protein
MSLRTKLIATVLLGCLISVAVVGGVAFMRLMSKFDDLILKSAAAHFQADTVSYYRTYGSWEAAVKAEPFRQFVIRRKAAANETLQAGLPPGERAPEAPLGGKDPALSTDALPPAGATQPMVLKYADTMAPLPFSPPFRFLLYKPDGHVVLGTDLYKTGDRVRDEDRRQSLPVMLDGGLIGYVSPLGRINYSELDLGYIKAMRDALLYGAVAAAVVALALGIATGTGLTRSLRRLTTAIQAMESGTLGQQVEVTSRDEIGVLGTAFNRMSTELHRQTEDLRQSYQTIREQAERLNELSIRDGLTQLYNRRHL